ncbi:MAG: methanesulfonate monooxygenase [Rhodospirillales bacterium]|jgi:methanesulfonate monooxygenase small subunit|nr:methanesulfonate monooxygenase [Rhodospirillales bacterium]
MKVDREAVRELIGRSCLLMDEERYADYLGLCTDDYSYRVTAFSAELRKDMIWLELSRNDLGSMFDMLPEHVKPEGTFVRHANVCAIQANGGADRVHVTSTLTVYFTDLRGTSRLFAIGRYEDEVDVSGEEPRLKARDVRLETRALGTGSQIPL